MTLSITESATHVIRSDGSIDPEGLRECLGLRPAELSQAIGVSPSTIGRGASSPRSQDAMREIYALFVRTTGLFKGNEDYARIWLHAPNPELDFKRPIEYVIKRRPKILDAFLGSVQEGSP